MWRSHTRPGMAQRAATMAVFGRPFLALRVQRLTAPSAPNFGRLDPSTINEPRSSVSALTADDESISGALTLRTSASALMEPIISVLIGVLD